MQYSTILSYCIGYLGKIIVIIVSIVGIERNLYKFLQYRIESIIKYRNLLRYYHDIFDILVS